MTVKPLVAVTGASGYIALHVIEKLLRDGFEVRGTLRDMSRAAQVQEALAKHADVEPLSFVAADLMSDAGWAAALSDCRYVLHMASPLPKRPPKDEDELIVPAREGTLRVLRASLDAGVSRVVITSSLSAIRHGPDVGRPFDERDWSDTSLPMAAYAKSKTVAERAAWDFAANLPPDQSLEIVAINPGVVLGPLLDADGSSSIEAVRKLMAREMPGCPRLGFAFVDVRDVADAHVLALTSPVAAGKRYVCSSESLWFSELADILRAHVGGKGYKIPTRKLPNWLVRLVGVFDPTVRLIVPELGRWNQYDTSAIETDLQWSARPIAESIRDTADSLIEHGIV